MANVYSTQFLTWSNPTSGVLYTVPAGYVAVVRDMDVWWDGETDEGSLIASIHNVCTFMVFYGAPSVASAFQWRGRVVINPGEKLELFPSVGNWSGVACGYLLSLP